MVIGTVGQWPSPLVEGQAQSQTVHCPSPTLQEVDWEVELAVVIGKTGKHIKVRWKGQYPPSLAWKVVAP